MNSHKSNSEKTILSLPNEIIHKIFSHILNSGEFRVKFQDENGNDHNLPQILVLRSVTRRFRAIGNKADMWHKQSFDLGQLFPYPSLLRNDRKYEAREGEFFKTLLSDTDLLCCLERKTAWQFSSLEGLFAVLRDVPSFQQNARAITLDDFKNGLFVALDRLRACDRVTKISASLPYEYGDLNLVTDSFPFLEELELFELDEFRGIMRHNASLSIGSLQANSRLQTLVLGFANPDRANPKFFQRLLLPLNSAKTLTKLVLHDCDRISDDIPTSLSIFRNLKELRLNSIPDGFRDVLNHATFTLTTFKVDFVDRHFPDMRAVLTSDSLRELKHLLIANVYSPDDEAQKNLVPFLVEQFQFLEILELGTELALPLQCPLFTSLRRLRSLRISVPHILTHDGETHNMVEGPKESVESRRRIVHDAFLEAFAGIVKKPEIFLEKSYFDVWM